MDLELPDIDNPAAVTSLASEVESVGTRTFDLVSSAQETWYNLSGTYRAPEAEAVYNGMREPLKFASALQVSTKLAKRALDEYAAKLVEFHVRKAQLEVEIMAAQLAMARALAMPRTKTEKNSDGENEEVPNEEREEAIAEAQDKLEHLENEVKKLRDDMDKADSALASTLDGSATNVTKGGPATPNDPFERLRQGALDSIKDTFLLVGDLLKLEVKGAKFLWNNRDEILKAARGLDDFFENGGLDRMKSTVARALMKFRSRDIGSAALRGTKNLLAGEYRDFKTDPAYYIGGFIPDAITSVFTGGGAGALKIGVTSTAKATAGLAAKGGAKAAAGAAIKGAGGVGTKGAATLGIGAAARRSAKNAGRNAGDAIAKAGTHGATKHFDDAARAGRKRTAHTHPNRSAIDASKSVNPAHSGAGAPAKSHFATQAVDNADGPHIKDRFGRNSGEPLTFVDGRNAANVGVDDRLLRESRDAHKYHQGGPLGAVTENIDSAHTPQPHSGFTRHHYVNYSPIPPSPSMPANEFYASRARASMIEDATLHGDYDRVEYLQKLDDSAIKAEHQQFSFDKYVERHTVDGSEFEFKNNLERDPLKQWRDANLTHEINEGGYKPKSNELLPEGGLPEKIDRPRGYAPDPKVHVADYVNENLREVTVEVGQNKVVHRIYPDYMETEAIVLEKFTAVKRLDGPAAREWIKEIGKLTNDEAGHMMAHMYAPNSGIGNYLPQFTDVNKKTIYGIETSQMDAIMKEDTFTHFSTRATLDPTGRPESYHAIADFYDRETGNQWLRIDGAMPNGEHPIFDRNPAKSELPMKHIDLRDKNLSEVKRNALDSGSVNWLHFDLVKNP